MAARISGATLGEWSAFEREYGPILVHERIDWGLAMLRTIGEGGGRLKLPPWYERDEGDGADAMLAALRSLADRNKE